MSETLWLLPVVLVAGLASVWFTLRPLRQGALAGVDGTLEGDDRVAARKTVALESLRELERDYQLGSLEEREYRALRQEIEGQALRALKAEDAEAATLERAVVVAVERARAGLPVVGRPAAAYAPAVVQDRVVSGSPARAHAPSEPLGQTTPQAVSQPGSRPRRGVFVAAAAALAVAFAAGTLWLTLRAPTRGVQQPLASLPAQRVQAVALDPANPSRAVAASDAGLLASADGGRTWQPLAGPGGEVVALALPAGRPGTIYAASTDRLVRTGDGGQSWTPFEAGPPGGRPRALAADPQVPGDLYAILDDTLLRSEDAGASWAPVAGQRLGAEATSLVVVPAGPASPRLLFAGTIGGGVLASGDEGVSWGNASGFVNGALPTTAVRSLAYDPASGDRFEGTGGTRFSGALYAGTDAGLFKSTDGGSSWTRLPLDARVVAVAVTPADSRVLLAVDDQARLFRSDDRGLTWPGVPTR